MRFLHSPVVTVIVAVALFSTLSSCTDHFSSLNEPPTSVTEVDPSFAFTEAIRDNDVNHQNWEWTQARLFGGWAQHFAAPNRNDGLPNYYEQHRRNDDAFWEHKYTTVLKNLDRTKAELNRVGESPSDPAVRTRLAMVKIYETMVFETLTAGLGDIPFSEAVQGLGGNTTPVYDQQSEIYPDLLDTLDTYVSQLTDSDRAFGEADIIYGGDVERWRRFGNSLKLRTAMRMRYANPDAAQDAVEDAMSSRLISSHTESAMVPTQADAGPDANAHPILREYRSGRGDKSRLGEHLVEMLKANDDPRLELIAEPTATSKEEFDQTGDPDDLEYAGIPPNMTTEGYDNLDVSDVSYVAFDIWANEDLAVPAHVLTYPEVLFLQAEAALLGWGGTMSDAQSYYEQGIRAALTMAPYDNAGFDGYEITQSDIDDYVASQTPLSSDVETALEQISEQRYVALFSRGDQTFFEWRRTGYPQLDTGTRTDNYTNGDIPRKAFYHQSEESLNAENWQEAVDRQGGGGYNADIWIDQNSNNGQLD